MDPFNFEVLYDDCINASSALSLLAQQLVLPVHIWKPIVQYGYPTGFAPDPNVVGSGPWRFSSFTPSDSMILIANKLDAGASYRDSGPIDVDIHTLDFSSKSNPDSLVTFRVTLQNIWLNRSIEAALTTKEYVYFDDQLLFTSTKELFSCKPQVENISCFLSKGFHNITVSVYVEGPPKLDSMHNNPWISQWVNVTLSIWSTIPYDIVGGRFINQYMSAPDIKVDIQDISCAARSFATCPSDARWNVFADVIANYRIDVRDIAFIARRFGWR
jgi:hypothetical protein